MTSAFNTTVILALLAAAALRPPIPRRPSPFRLSFAFGWWINEAPLIGLWWLLAGTLGTLISPEQSVWWWLVAVLTVADGAMLSRIAVRALSARPALSAALRAAFGPNAAPRYTRPPWWRLLMPVIFWRPDVRRIRNRRYGPARRGNRLDVYVPRRRRRGAGAAPVLVYFHAMFANKSIGSRALIYRLAAQGWVCVAAGRRQIGAGTGEQLADIRAALTWVRHHARDYGGDPERIVAAGGSAGAGLAAAAVLGGCDVAAVIGLYGYYGMADPGSTSPPPQATGTDVPPFFLIHGTLDTLVPAREARRFADRLRTVSSRPVVYAELPGAQHSFDIFHSVRIHAVAGAVVRFAELTIGTDGADGGHGPLRETRRRTRRVVAPRQRTIPDVARRKDSRP